MRSAIIATVLNEAQHIREFLASLEAQSRFPDVIVITDGGSTDGTQKILQDFAASSRLPFRWEVVPGNRSRGRNAAIRRANVDVVAVTDVNVLDPRWFERIVDPLLRGDADVVAGWYEPLGDSARDRAMGLLTLYSLQEIDPVSFVPASRSLAFTRSAWERVHGYEERLDAAEDTHLALSMRRAGLRFVLQANAIVRCWTPSSPREAFRTYRAYAKADGRARHLGAPQTHYGRLYGIYGTGLVLLLLALVWPFVWLGLFAGGVTYSLFRIRKVLRARLYTLVPVSLAVGVAVDLAQVLGYFEGRIQPLDVRTERSWAEGPSNDA